MKKKKGFTLIELLAVIVVLAIILVLAVPKILDLIEKADRQAYKESAELMAHTAQIQYQTKEVTGTAPVIPEEGIVYTFEEGVQTVSGNYDLLKFKGDKPYSGTITLTKDKKVIIEKLVSKNKKWCAIKEANEKQARVGRSTDPEFACIIEEDVPIEDKTACELESNKDETIYYIDSPSDLYAFSKSVNSGTDYSGKTIKVRNDLDMSDISNTCDETSFSPIGTPDKPFNGIFDGGAKTISNLTINRPNQSYIGLFGYVSGTEENKAKIHGVRLVNEVDSDGNIKGSISGYQYTGGLVGYIDTNYVEIKEIELDNIKITSKHRNTGGLVGHIQNAPVINNILIKNGSISSTNHTVGLVHGSNASGFTNTIVEKVTKSSVNSAFEYSTMSGNITYHSNKCSFSGGVNGTFDASYINDIYYYKGILETLFTGDANNTGYFFDYVDEKGGIYLVKAYTLTPPTTEDTGESIGPSTGVCSRYPCTCECGCICNDGSDGATQTRCEAGCK